MYCPISTILAVGFHKNVHMGRTPPWCIPRGILWCTLWYLPWGERYIIGDARHGDPRDVPRGMRCALICTTGLHHGDDGGGGGDNYGAHDEYYDNMRKTMAMSEKDNENDHDNENGNNNENGNDNENENNNENENDEDNDDDNDNDNDYHDDDDNDNDTDDDDHDLSLIHI